MSKTASAKISSGEFQRAFGRYRELALQSPVAITNHGRESLVLLSASEYKRLKQLDRRALHPWEMSEDAIGALLTAEPPAETAKFDLETRPQRRRRR